MRKIIGSTLIIILILFLILLSKRLFIEEILGFYLILIILTVLFSSMLYGIIRVFKAISYKKFITNSLVVACVLLIGLLFQLLASTSSQYFTKNEVISDIDYAIKVAEEVHPNLYAVISKESFLNKVDSIKKSLSEKVLDVEAYRTIRKIFAQIHDGHTGINGYSFKYKGLFDKNIPYKFDIRNGRIFVTDNYTYRNKIPIGSEVIKINGKPTLQCLNEIEQIVSYESVPLLNERLKDCRFWGVWNNYNNFEITFKAPDSGIIRTIKTSGGLISNLIFRSRSKIDHSPYSFKVIPNNIGFIEFNSLSGKKETFRIFLDSTFKMIKNQHISALIIDIRRNGGGDENIGAELMQYISKTNFKTFDTTYWKVSNEILECGKLNLNDLDSSERKIGTVIRLNHPQIKLRETPLRFFGQTYLLTSGKTFSSASAFASSFQCYNVGKIIGTETGGITVCYGNIYGFELPNTKFRMNVSWNKIIQTCGTENRRGVLPDFIVENSIEDEQKGIDKVLEFTINLIKQNKK